jgi:hypothetical protein
MELVPTTIEIADHEDLFRRRLQEVEDDAATARFGTPILFLAGLEVEFQLSENNIPEPARKAHERQARVAQIREEAITYIQDLIENETDEAAREAYRSWLPQLNGFSARDWLNLRLYQEFSHPTPAPVHAPRFASFETMCSYSEEAGVLECRFGKGRFQAGYYDWDSRCEIRLAPCSPSELIKREAIVLQRIHQLCEELHLSYQSVVDHVNLSMYTKQGDQYQPIIGNDPARLDATLDIVAGLSAALELGTCIAPQTITDTGLLGKTSFFRISRFRDHARIKDDYLEWRAYEFGSSSTAHKLLWLIAGTAFGLECGTEYVTEDLEIGRPYIEEGLRTHRTPNFQKERDKKLQRVLDYSTRGNHGRLVPTPRLVDDFAFLLVESLFGETDITRERAQGLVRIFLYALDTDDDGRIFIDQEFWDEQLQGAAQDQCDALRAPFEWLVRQDGVRLSMGKSINSNPVLFGGSVADRSRYYWPDCEIMHRTYGSYTEAYIAFLRDLEEATTQPPPPPKKLTLPVILRGNYL